MNDAIQFHSRVGDDGMLNIQVNLGQQEAQRDVVVTVESLTVDDERSRVTALSWSEFVKTTYGSCAGLELKRHEQGEFESREPIA